MDYKNLEKQVMDNVRFSVSLFHGSPHSFDKFSTDYMGTGEGAQAYGWGLYFTDREEIAKRYANMGGVKIENLSIRGLPLYSKGSAVDYDYRKTGEYIATLQENLLINENMFKKEILTIS